MSLDVEIGLKNARFRQGLEQVRGQAKQFSGDLKGMIAGAFTVGAILSFAQKMREVQNQALRLGTSAESVQRIGKVAKLADVDFEALAKSINKVTSEAGKAANGDKAAGNLFAKLHLDAVAFMKLNPEDKLVALSAAFQQSRSSGQGTTAMLDLLGMKGVQIIPLLARGPQALSTGMKEATIQTNSTVEAMAKLSRQVDKIKGFGARVTGMGIGAVRSVAAFAGWVTSDEFTDGAKADLESENMKRRHAGQKEITGAEASHWIAERERKTRNAAMGESLKDEDKSDNASPADDFDPNEAGAAASEKQKETLLGQIADQEAKNRADQLQGEAKINELIEQRQALMQQVNNDTVEGLEAKKKMLDLDHEIDALQKAQQAKYDQAEKSESKELEKQYLDKANPKQKAKYLSDKQRRLYKEAKDETDPVKAIEKRTEAEALDPEIAAAKKSKSDRLSVAVDSLQRVGGGGGIGGATDPILRESQQQTQLLRQLVQLQRGDVLIGKEATKQPQ